MDFKATHSPDDAIKEADALLISKKGLTRFPEGLLSKCQFLKNCYLSSNLLVELPETFFLSMACLQWLDIRDNNVETLPTHGLANHGCLHTLLLQNNRIQILPHQLGLVQNLRGLQVAGNPIVNVPFEIIAAGFLKLIKYLRKLPQDQAALQPVSETIITNPFPPEARSTKSTYAFSHGKKVVNDKRSLNVKNKATTAGESDGSVKKKPSLRSCSKMTSACKAFREPNALVTPEKIQLKTEKLRQRGRLRETMQRQTQMLQRLKDLETLKKWRNEQAKTDKQRLLDNCQMHSSKNGRLATPFDLDRDMMKMLSRKDIYMSLKDWEQKKRRETVIQRKTSRNNNIRGMEDLIDQLSEQLTELDLEIQQDMESKAKKVTLCSRINQINKLRRTLQNLHGKHLNME